jgi:hypothetical protein
MRRSIQVSDNLLSAAIEAATFSNQSVSEQIQYWAMIGKACIDNPDLPVSFVIDSLTSLSATESSVPESLFRKTL